MPAGDVYDQGNVVLEVVRASRDTEGAFLEIAATYAGGSKPPPLHYHPEQEEVFTLRRGALRFIVGNEERVVATGEELVIPQKVPHKAWNASATEEAVATWITRPALRTEELFAALYNLRRKRAGFLARVAVIHSHRREFALGGIPRPVQTCVFGLLAPLARALGHRPEG